MCVNICAYTWFENRVNLQTRQNNIKITYSQKNKNCFFKHCVPPILEKKFDRKT